MPYNQLCWICLTITDEDLKNMTQAFCSDVPYLTIYYETVGKKIVPFEEYSPRICPSCEIEMLEAYKFRKRCQDIEKKICKLFEHGSTSAEIAKMQYMMIESHKRGSSTAHQIDHASSDTERDAQSCSENIRKIKREAGVEIKERRKKFRCKVCRVIFEELQNFQYHKCMSYEVQILKEIKAVYINRKKRPLEIAQDNIPKKEKDIKEEYTCEKCKKVFISRRGFLLHMDLHNNTARYDCDQCGKKFQHWRSRRTHMYKIHLQKPLCTCPHCGKGFYQVKYMKTHIQEHHPEHSTSSGSQLIKDKQTKENKAYQCDKCGKNFKSKGSFYDHQNVHKGAVTCDICGKKLKTQKTYAKHMDIHSKTLNYVCPVCDMRFVRNIAMKRHVKKVHPDQIHLIPEKGTIVNQEFLKKNHIQPTGSFSERSEAQFSKTELHNAIEMIDLDDMDD